MSLMAFAWEMSPPRPTVVTAKESHVATAADASISNGEKSSGERSGVCTRVRVSSKPSDIKRAKSSDSLAARL